MQIRINQTENRVTMEVVGTIDTNTSAELSAALTALDYRQLDLTLDFRGTDYITSAGLRVLLVARKKLKSENMRIVNASERVLDVFRVTGFDQILNVSGSELAADAEMMRMSFKALLKKRVREAPNGVAFAYADRSYTWMDVEKASQIIADDLSKAGVGKGCHVGLYSVNSINWIFTFFAIQKLGAIAVFVNFGLKARELAAVAEIGSITHLCLGTVTGIQDPAEARGAVRFVYDIGSQIDFTARFDEYDGISNRFGETYHTDDACVIIFTSGSTGQPKAVLLSAYSVLSCMKPILKGIQYFPDDRNLAFLPFFHIFGFISCIAIGLARDFMSVIPRSVKPQAMIDIIEKYRCTLFHTVPNMLLSIIRAPEFSPERVSSVRFSGIGGSAATQEQLRALCAAFPNNHFMNLYGMSENGIISMTGYGDTFEHISQTVGKPVEGLELEIREPGTGRILPPGTVGEIHVRSASMAVCYYNLPIEDQPLDSEGWLATGDLGVLLPDGYLKLAGRSKDIIIRNGENISPGEVAEAITALPEVAEALVFGIPHEVYGEEVAAAVIPKPGQTFDPESAAKRLGERLARYKIPAKYLVLSEFPLLGSGKADVGKMRRALTQEQA